MFLKKLKLNILTKIGQALHVVGKLLMSEVFFRGFHNF